MEKRNVTKIETRNVTLTNLTNAQCAWLEKESTERGMTITGLIKHIAEVGIKETRKKHDMQTPGK